MGSVLSLNAVVGEVFNGLKDRGIELGEEVFFGGGKEGGVVAEHEFDGKGMGSAAEYFADGEGIAVGSCGKGYEEEDAVGQGLRG